MTQVAIQAEGLGKRYRRGQLASSDTLYETLTRVVRSPLSFLRRTPQDTFWALRDVSLEVREGEVLGLIGRNGAGKTTLLKILSRITRPTTGWVEIHGRVRSLLEVGTGFHAELTGRENTYLSGSILGMSKREIKGKFDEIVAFAEIDKFIDTPVKHYSSGMYVRLAFAVAAHLEPEILLVDEVLAVGDIAFQKKCLGKMGDVARAGRTVVLVSHQLNQIRRLCHRAVWVDGGQIRMASSAHEVVSAYESAMAFGDRNRSQKVDRSTTAGRFVSWEIVQPHGGEPHVLNHLDPVAVKFTVQINVPVKNGQHGIALYNHDRQLIWASSGDNLQLEPGEYEFCHTFPTLPLRPGPYSWLVSLFDEGQQLDSWDCLPDMIVATENYQHSHDQWNGILNMPGRFEIKKRFIVQKTWQFDNDFTQRYTKVRQDFAREFLAEIRQQIPLESAADVGCGVGYFSKFLSDMGFRVVAIDGRAENSAEGKRRYPEITFLTRNAEEPSLEDVGVLDFVLCTGLLYHLENPFRAIRNLHTLTGKVLTIETMCAPGTEPNMYLLDESEKEDQGLNYVAFYPTEPCLVKMLYRAGFPFVYRFKRLPSDAQFNTTIWRKQSRSFLVASKMELTAPNLILVTEPIRPHFGKANLWTTRLSRLRDDWGPSREVWASKLFNLRVIASRFLKSGGRRPAPPSSENKFGLKKI